MTRGTPSYPVTEMRFDRYEISKTEILKSSVGMDILGKWIGLDPRLSRDERRICLIDIFRERYVTEYSNLRTLAVRQGQAVEEQTHNQYIDIVRRLYNIRHDSSSMG